MDRAICSHAVRSERLCGGISYAVTAKVEPESNGLDRSCTDQQVRYLFRFPLALPIPL